MALALGIAPVFAEEEPDAAPVEETAPAFKRGYDRWFASITPKPGSEEKVRRALRFQEDETACLAKLRSSEKKYGESSLFLARAVVDLAHLYEGVGDFVRAESYYRRALGTLETPTGSPSANYLIVLNDLAGLLVQQGDYVGAEPLLQQVLKATERSREEQSPRYANVVGNLAELYMEMGDYARAVPLSQQVVEIRKAGIGRPPKVAFGPYYRGFTKPVDERTRASQRRDYAISLHNLGLLYERIDDYQRAEPLLQQDLKITAEVYGQDHPDYAHSLETLAFLYVRMEKYALAEPRLQQAVTVYENTLGKEHPSYARAVNSLGYLYVHTGEYQRAETLLNEAVRRQEKVLGEMHPDHADSLNNLATAYYAKGDYPQAASTFRNALRIVRHGMELTSAIQSERQQLAMAKRFRERLDLYLSLASHAGLPGDDVYAELLAWKGAVFGHQRQMRRLRGHPELAKPFEALERTARRLATLALAQPAAGEAERWKQEIRDLTEEKERLEGELAGSSAEFRRSRARQDRTPRQVQAVLPDSFALIDFLEYTHWNFDESKQLSKQRRLIAFIIQPDRPIRLVNLGLVEPITAEIDRWRSTFGPAIRNDGIAACNRLRELLWTPLKPHLHGATTVLISPDGALSQLPWAVLPGQNPDGYLIESYAFAIVPVPQMLPGLLDGQDDIESDDSPPTMCLVGDVDFDASPGGGAEMATVPTRVWRRRRAGGLQAWSRLPGTRGEILSIGDSFKKAVPGAAPKILREGEATEMAVRNEAPKHEYLHFATHGFFAPPKLKSLLANRERPGRSGSELFDRQSVVGFHPGLLSGIALAGANKPAVDGDDGVLTALEVAQLDLRKAELVVLSACETGLGEVAGGEGVLGLQRAFQVAGAKSVVTSLWKVDDQATRKLMERFYENYWTREMGMLESLREAQLWMLREGYQRAAVRLDQEKSKDQPTRTPPYYWAGFVLSGDWR